MTTVDMSKFAVSEIIRRNKADISSTNDANVVRICDESRILTHRMLLVNILIQLKDMQQR